GVTGSHRERHTSARRQRLPLLGKFSVPAATKSTSTTSHVRSAHCTVKTAGPLRSWQTLCRALGRRPLPRRNARKTCSAGTQSKDSAAMALNIEAFENWTFPSLSQSYTDKDTMLYAVSIGFGQDPLSPLELPFVFEEGLKAVPSFAAILCHPGAWSSDPAFGVTRHRVVHGEQRIFMHQPLPPEGKLFAHASVYGVEDKGEKGAIIHAARTLSDHQTKLPIVSVLHSSFARADGVFGSNLGKTPEPTGPRPATAPDLEIDIVTR